MARQRLSPSTNFVEGDEAVVVHRRSPVSHRVVLAIAFNALNVLLTHAFGIFYLRLVSLLLQARTIQLLTLLNLLRPRTELLTQGQLVDGQLQALALFCNLTLQSVNGLLTITRQVQPAST